MAGVVVYVLPRHLNNIKWWTSGAYAREFTAVLPGQKWAQCYGGQALKTGKLFFPLIGDNHALRKTCLLLADFLPCLSNSAAITAGLDRRSLDVFRRRVFEKCRGSPGSGCETPSSKLSSSADLRCTMPFFTAYSKKNGCPPLAENSAGLPP